MKALNLSPNACQDWFSLLAASVQSILSLTPAVHEILYIDAGPVGEATQSFIRSLETSQRNFRIVGWYRFLLAYDTSWDFCRPMLHACPLIVAVPPYQNAYVSRNVAIQLATTPYIVLLNNDVIVHPLWLENLVLSAERHQTAAIVQPLLLEESNLQGRRSGGLHVWWEQIHLLQCDRPANAHEGSLTCLGLDYI